MITKIAHVGIATRSLEASREFFVEALGLKCEATEIVDDQKVRAALLHVGESCIELLEPTEDKSAIGHFLDKYGPGMHHLTLEVDDLEAHLKRLSALKVRLIDERPRRGADGKWIAFIHPYSTGGVLIELCQADPPGRGAQE
jgi:methylmalonyl-CoA/ethylmalonyl-CoA epimerase